MLANQLALASKIHDEQCVQCKEYKPKNKNYCGISKQIITPLLRDGIFNSYAKWLFNKVPYKDGVCPNYKKKEE